MKASCVYRLKSSWDTHLLSRGHPDTIRQTLQQIFSSPTHIIANNHVKLFVCTAKKHSFSGTKVKILLRLNLHSSCHIGKHFIVWGLWSSLTVPRSGTLLLLRLQLVRWIECLTTSIEVFFAIDYVSIPLKFSQNMLKAHGLKPNTVTHRNKWSLWSYTYRITCEIFRNNIGIEKLILKLCTVNSVAETLLCKLYI